MTIYGQHCKVILLDTTGGKKMDTVVWVHALIYMNLSHYVFLVGRVLEQYQLRSPFVKQNYSVIFRFYVYRLHVLVTSKEMFH